MSSVRDPLAGFRPTWVEIDLDAFARNVTALRSMLPERSRLIAVLKADGYGHGGVELATLCEARGVAMIALSLLEEALELRRAGISLPLLILGPLKGEQVPAAIESGFTIGIVGPEELRAVCSAATRDVAVHVKLDSGLSRMGFLASDLDEMIAMLRAHPSVRVDALYTHFANATDPDDPSTNEQIARFETMTARLRDAGIDPPLHHLGNSAATVRHLVNAGDYVRIGLSLFGAEPLDHGESKLEPVMRWRSEIARLKELPEGAAIGYGATFRTARPSRIATLPVGYADGFDRALSNNADVLVRGRRAPVVGRVSMDLVTIDVTGVPGVANGDEVTLLGTDGDETINVEELARKAGTISWDLFCNIGWRVPRVFRSGGAITHVRSRFASETAAKTS